MSEHTPCTELRPQTSGDLNPFFFQVDLTKDRHVLRTLRNIVQALRFCFANAILRVRQPAISKICLAVKAMSIKLCVWASASASHQF